MTKKKSGDSFLEAYLGKLYRMMGELYTVFDGIEDMIRNGEPDRAADMCAKVKAMINNHGETMNKLAAESKLEKITKMLEENKNDKDV